MKLNMSPTRQKYPLSFNKVYKKTISSVLGLIILIAFFGGFILVPFIGIIGSSNTAPDVVLDFLTKWIFILPVTLLLIIIWQYVYQLWYFAVYYYDITENFLVIRKHPITPQEITIPWERIQDVYVDQDLWDRVFGLYDVHLSTATIESGIQAHIDGVEKQAADGLRDELLTKVKSKMVQTGSK